MFFPAAKSHFTFTAEFMEFQQLAFETKVLVEEKFPLDGEGR